MSFLSHFRSGRLPSPNGPDGFIGNAHQPPVFNSTFYTFQLLFQDILSLFLLSFLEVLANANYFVQTWLLGSFHFPCHDFSWLLHQSSSLRMTDYHPVYTEILYLFSTNLPCKCACHILRYILRTNVYGSIKQRFSRSYVYEHRSDDHFHFFRVEFNFIHNLINYFPNKSNRTVALPVAAYQLLTLRG
jgi:hypothetical protein